MKENKSLYIFKSPTTGSHVHIKKNNVVVVFNRKGEVIQIGRIATTRAEFIDYLIKKGYKEREEF